MSGDLLGARLLRADLSRGPPHRRGEIDRFRPGIGMIRIAARRAWSCPCVSEGLDRVLHHTWRMAPAWAGAGGLRLAPHSHR